MTLSIRTALRDFTHDTLDIKCVVRTDGMTLPTFKEKPFALVSLMNDAYVTETKRRDSVTRSELYQITILPQTDRQQNELSEKLSEAFLFANFTDFRVTNVHIQPLPPADLSDELNRHRVYLSVTIERTIHRK